MSLQSATKEKAEKPNPLALDVAVEATKRYAARIVDDPKACPMFPLVTEHNGPLETLCYMQGYLAGIVGFTGAIPSRKVMDALVHDALSDDNVRDIVVKMAPSLEDVIHPAQDY